MIAPTLMDNVSSDAKLSCQEVFGPVAVIETYHDFDDVLARVNDSRYGINAGVFTNDINKAWRAFETLEVGCVVINDSPHFRIDRMPYGGVKESGFGREGVQYTMEEMQEIKAMIVNLGIAD
jgi:acyl-CoA reductase-like NAD-dependent aldehyde dehydrogenase